MSKDRRSIELEIDVAGSPEQVWQAIATGPGISSWYVPHTVEERAGGTVTASFGPGSQMQVTGRIVAWEPPRRVVFHGDEGVDGLAFEWTVAARDDETCTVRLVNTGFGTGQDWDAQYDGMTEGWGLFLLNLALHLEHFPGQVARAALPTATWSGTRDTAWAALIQALGLPTAPVVGERLDVTAADAPALAGTVIDTAPWRLTLLLDQPCPGTAFLTVEGSADPVFVSIWSYLYGVDAASTAERDESRWQEWLTTHAPH
jgi:uncharacterized protein YndB with AHSA1/START domain